MHKFKLIRASNWPTYLTESLYKVKTKYIVADFSCGKEIYDEIEKQLTGIPVGILGKSFRVGVAISTQ